MSVHPTIAKPIEWRYVGLCLVGKHPTLSTEFWISPDDAASSWSLRLEPYDLGNHPSLTRARDHAQQWVDVGALSGLSSVALHAMSDRLVTLAEINPPVYGDLARMVTDYVVSEGRRPHAVATAKT